MFVKLQCIDTNPLYLYITSINNNSSSSKVGAFIELKKKQKQTDANICILKHKNPFSNEPISNQISFTPYPGDKTTNISVRDEYEHNLGLKLRFVDKRRVVNKSPARCLIKCLNHYEKKRSHNIGLNYTVGEDPKARCSIKWMDRDEQNDKIKKKDEQNERVSATTRCGTYTKIWKKQKCTKKSSTQTMYKQSLDNGSISVSRKCIRYRGCVPKILKSLENVDDLDVALRPWEGSLSNKEMSIILKEQSSWVRALDIFEWFKRKGCYDVNVIHYNIMFKILGEARRWNLIESLWVEMKERNVVPVNSTYGTLIDVYSKGELNKEAFDWLELMREQDIEPDEVSMAIIVQMYKKAREYKKAENFFKTWKLAKKPPVFIDGDVGCVHLSSYTYNTLIDTYGKAGQLKEASETFKKMLIEGILPTTVTFNSLIHMYGYHGRLDEVKLLITKMEEFNCKPDNRTYNILIYINAKNDEIKTAEKYFTTMKERSLEPDPVSYRTLLYAFSARQMVTRAENLISEMNEKGLKIDEFTQSALTRMYIEAGMIEKSWAWFTRFHLEGKMSSDFYSANIDAFGVRGHVLEAEKVFISCLEGRKPSVLEFNVMIKAYGLSKRYEKACELFDNMNKYDVFPDKCSYSTLIQILASADLPHVAVIYVRKMQKAGLIDDCIAYCPVISSFAKLGELAKAEEIFNEMIRYKLQPDVVAYGVLINAFSDNGNVEKVLYYVKSMEKARVPVNTVICNSMIKLYNRVENLTEAEKIYKKLQSFEEGPSAFSSNCMLNLYSKRSMAMQAEGIFRNLKRKGNANEFSYAMILCMYKRLGRFQEAIFIAREMRELGLLTFLLSYNQVLDVYALAGRFREAFRMFEEMMTCHIRPDDSTFKSLGSVLCKCGVSERAVDELEKTRRKDPERGLRNWFSTLECVVCLENDENSN